MEVKKLNNLLRERARELGLCDEWYGEWKSDCTTQELIGKYLTGIDFCIKHDYPRLEFIRAYWNKDLLLSNGIFLDKTVDGSNVKTAVLLGESNGTLRYYGEAVGNVYVRHKSMVSVVAENGAKVFVEVYEGGVVEAVADDTSKVFVYWHGGTVRTDGNVTVRDKRKAEG